ncbi:MAG: PRTRC system protein C [Armatimonadota bacterium]
MREFRFNGAILADPNPNMSAEEVRQMYAQAGYPALTNGSVVGPETINGRQVYTFKAAVGTKG